MHAVLTELTFEGTESQSAQNGQGYFSTSVGEWSAPQKKNGLGYIRLSYEKRKEW